jgi:hypothetical protein
MMADVTGEEVSDALYSCLQRYVSEVIDSIEFSKGRELTELESNTVYASMEHFIGEKCDEFKKLNSLGDIPGSGMALS